MQTPLQIGQIKRVKTRKKQAIEKFYNRFWNKVAISGLDNCWTWTGRPNEKGYGLISLNSKEYRAHRVSFNLSRQRSLNEGVNICHSCDNPACCNPVHLFEGTPRDNSDDMVAKGRSAFGERHSHAKLKEAEVLEIIEMRKTGMLQREIAAAFGVARRTISLITTGKRWKHISKCHSVH